MKKELKMAIQGILGMVLFFIIGSFTIDAKTLIMIACVVGIIGLTWWDEVTK